MRHERSVEIAEELATRGLHEPCFPGSTKVQVPGGFKAISEFLIGDEIQCYDFDEKKIVTSIVVAVGERMGPNPVFELDAPEGSLHVLPGHFFHVGEGWIPIEDLGSSFEALGADSTLSFHVKAADQMLEGEVYNLRVRRFNNYMVGSYGLIVRDY